VARIGNSRGVRLPAGTLKRYGIVSAVMMEERSDGILLRSPGPAVEKLSWDATARAMAAETEEWRDLEAANADGLEEIPWEPSRRRQAKASASRKR
jgi:antitoxin component of MazEF toxin-antitoxin module